MLGWGCWRVIAVESQPGHERTHPQAGIGNMDPETYEGDVLFQLVVGLPGISPADPEKLYRTHIRPTHFLEFLLGRPRI